MEKLPREGHGISIFEELWKQIREMATRNNPGIDVPALLYSAETQEIKVFYSCCDSETCRNNNALAAFL